MHFGLRSVPVASRLLLALAPLGAFAQLNITRQPDSLVTVASGQPATLTVGATATPAPTYQWRRYGTPIAGATNATYQIPAARQFDNDFYDVLITSGSTTALSQTARLLVTLPSYPQAVTTDPARSFLLEGAEASYDGAGPALTPAVLPDGRFYLAGAFSSINGQPRRDLARFNANGTLDPTFTAPVFDSRPAALAVQSDGKLLVAGTFRSVNGAAALGLVRLNPNGTVDATFTPALGFATAIAGSVQVAPNGDIYLTGSGIGTPLGAQAYIARLTSSGAVDTSFSSPTFGYGSGTINPSGFVFGPNGEIYVYGGFERVNDVARPRLARLLHSGALDPSFSPGSGPNNYIYAMTVLSNGQPVVGGDFTSFNGVPAGRIARLTTTGALDPAFATGAGFSSQVNFVAELPNGSVFVGSSGNVYNGAFVGGGARLNANGSLDPTFSYPLNGRTDALAILPGNRLLVTGGVTALTQPGVRVLEANGSISTAIAAPTVRFPARARVIAPLPGGKVLVAGDFTHVNGAPAPFVMRLNADLSRDASFPAGPGATSLVIRALVHPDGKMTLFTYNTMVRLNGDGSTDPTFGGFTPGGYWFPVPPVLLPDGRYFVPTDAPFWGGNAVTNGLVVLEANGTRASSHAYLPGPNPGTRITGVQRLAGGRLLVTGTFTSWNGIPRNNLVRLNADGSVDTTYGPDGTFQFAQFSAGMARNGWSIQRDGRLIVGADRQPTDTLARLNLDGSRDRGFVNELPQLFAGAGGLLVQPDDRIIVVAQGTPSLNTPPTGSLPNVFLRLTANGALDPSFSVHGSGLWTEMMLADNGELLSSDSSGHLHRYMALPAPTIAVPPSAQSAVAGTTIVLRVSAAGEEPFAYQWYRDDAPVTGATTATLLLENAGTSASGAYTVTVTNSGGTVTSPAARVSITNRPIAGATFGTVGGSAGTFALYLRDNGSGAFLAYLRDSRTVVTARNVSVGPDRRFRFTAATNATGSAPGTADVEGTIAGDGTVSGTVRGLTLAAPPATTSGPTLAQAGFYEAGEAGTSSLGYTIVGADGRAYTAAVTPVFADAGAVSIDGGGSGSATLEAGTRFSGILGGDGQALATLTPVAAPPLTLQGGDRDKRSDTEKLVNISTRSVVPAGQSFTVGFVVTGDRPKPILVRAIGPTLAAFQVTGALPAARLEVFRGTTSIAVGNDWGLAANAANIATTAARVGAFALPASSRDATLLLTLDPGSYSARVTGQADAGGVALVEVYDATEGPIARTQRIVNVSTLATAGAGSSTLTAGFFVAGSVPKRLLIRGAGPALAQFGVAGVLARPQVMVFSGSTLLAQNAGWSTSRDALALAAAAAEVEAFAFPAGSADAALIVNLAPGSYSAQVSGVGGTTGTALVEIYELP